MGLLDNTIFRISLVFDHLQYLASMGPWRWARRSGVCPAFGLCPFQKSGCCYTPALCVCLLLILGMTTWQRASAYESDETFWTDAVLKNPACFMGHNNLGNDLLQKGQAEDAFAQYQKALAMSPNYVAAHYKFGNALIKEETRRAIGQFQEALEDRPGYASAYINLGNALFQRGNWTRRSGRFQEALKINPEAETLFNSGDALLRKERLDEAIEQFQKALAITPNSVLTHTPLERLSLRRGN